MTLFLLFFSWDAFGQATNASINGIIKDDLGDPFVGATVLVENLSIGFKTYSITAENGSFNL